MKRTIFISAFLILFIYKVTSQTPNLIIYDNKKYLLHTNPLKSYFEKNPEREPKNKMVSTIKVRNYSSSFEIKNNSLYLNEIIAETEIHKFPNYNCTDKEDFELTWRSILKEIFPSQTNIKADWFTGSLILSRYNNYMILEINKGIITQKLSLTCEEYSKYKTNTLND